jgi:hypothetical protein
MAAPARGSARKLAATSQEREVRPSGTETQARRDFFNYFAPFVNNIQQISWRKNIFKSGSFQPP